MNIKRVIGGVLFLFFTIILTNTTFAVIPDSFENRYMTSGYGTYDERTEYGWTETPWLYLKMPDESLIIGNIWEKPSTSWKDPLGNNYIISGSGDSNEIWITLENWQEIKKAGVWEITTYFTIESPSPIGDITSFTVSPAVAPEPFSSILFIIGSAVFSGRHFLRKRKGA